MRHERVYKLNILCICDKIYLFLVQHGDWGCQTWEMSAGLWNAPPLYIMAAHLTTRSYPGLNYLKRKSLSWYTMVPISLRQGSSSCSLIKRKSVLKSATTLWNNYQIINYIFIRVMTFYLWFLFTFSMLVNQYKGAVCLIMIISSFSVI